MKIIPRAFAIATLAIIAAALWPSVEAHAGVRWPAQCRTIRCLNRHVNADHYRFVRHARRDAIRDANLASLVQQILDTTPPTNNVLQAEIDKLSQSTDNQLNQVWNKIGCWSTLPVARFDPRGAPSGTPYMNFGAGGSYPAYVPTFDGYFDIRHSGEPDTTYIYRFVWDSCASG